MPEIADALRGPWVAVLADRYGFVYPSVTDAADSAEADHDEFMIYVVRDSATPNDRGGTTGVLHRMPMSYNTGDIAHEIDAYLTEPDDPSIGVEARYAQAVAMAAGLNAAGGSSTGEQEPTHEVMIDVVEVAPDGTTHTYWSTHCRHGNHDLCKGSCKTCASACTCPCHPGQERTDG